MSVCNKLESPLDVFLAWPNASKAKRIPPFYEPATLVDHFINITNSTVGAGARSLNSREMSGLAQWQRCDKDTKASADGTKGFDLQCVFDAFNALFFEGRLAPVKVGWSGSLESVGWDWFSVVLGETVFQHGYQRQVGISILHHASTFWQRFDGPNIYGIILHEMVHAYFNLHACEKAFDRRIDAGLRNLGRTGHGPEWLRMLLALEQVASHHLGLGALDLGWKYSVEEEHDAVKSRCLMRKLIGAF